jgi:thioredoxin-dependent peroxiredoxin
MAKIAFKGNEVNTSGILPEVGSVAPDFTVVKTDLSELTLSSLKGQKVVLNIFPSIDTGVCAASTRRFNEAASSLENTTVLCISVDLPFALSRFCGAEGLENVVPASAFRTHDFYNGYGVSIVDSALKGLLSRAVIVVDETGKVAYTEQVEEITNEPNYEAALAALK